MFGRRRSADDRDVAQGASADLAAEAARDIAAAPATAGGPWDAADQYPAMERLDLGSLQIPVVEGMDIQLQLVGQQIACATVTHAQSAVQLQAFAAPRSDSLWDDLRGELAAEITAAGGESEEREGPFGREVRSRVLAEPGNPESRVPVRFAGVDGPRWCLRAVFTGAAAENPGAAAPLEAMMRDVVVVRGDHPVPPRELLEIRLPADAAQALAAEMARAQEQQQGKFNTPLNPFERGPEITETR